MMQLPRHGERSFGEHRFCRSRQILSVHAMQINGYAPVQILVQGFPVNIRRNQSAGTFEVVSAGDMLGSESITANAYNMLIAASFRFYDGDLGGLEHLTYPRGTC
jgi:hypothetical protein